ncbi:CDP-diacylglycerol--glycerol-3-phosphate 3-phosphatidyltransferase, partial [Clostridium botulinum]|nr:CDP-diacylglycerol--glycerol-3-phosphate 3-phosphatidyltransferase [Clostridium botulinum]
FSTIPNIMLIAAVIITIISGYEYFKKNKDSISTNK